MICSLITRPAFDARTSIQAPVARLAWVTFATSTICAMCSRSAIWTRLACSNTTILHHFNQTKLYACRYLYFSNSSTDFSSCFQMNIMQLRIECSQITNQTLHCFAQQFIYFTDKCQLHTAHSVFKQCLC